MMTARVDPDEQWFYDEIVRAYGMERETWALEQPKRVMAALQRARGRKRKAVNAVHGREEPAAAGKDAGEAEEAEMARAFAEWLTSG